MIMVLILNLIYFFPYEVYPEKLLTLLTTR
jgi:hypothetical protein